MKLLYYAIIVLLLANSMQALAAAMPKHGAAVQQMSARQTVLASARRVQSENQPNRWIRLCKQGQQCPSGDEFKDEFRRRSTIRA